MLPKIKIGYFLLGAFLGLLTLFSQVMTVNAQYLPSGSVSLFSPATNYFDTIRLYPFPTFAPLPTLRALPTLRPLPALGPLPRLPGDVPAPTLTPTNIPEPTVAPSPTGNPEPTVTPSVTPTTTATPSSTPTPTLSMTPSPTPTSTVTMEAQPGDVVINEVMWGGSSKSTADEWIELRNTTTHSIDLTGWTVENLGNATTLNAVLPESTILGKGYFLISHYNKDNSVLDIDPDFIFPSMNLSNGGEQLVLRDYKDTVIDVANDTGGWFEGSSIDPKSSMVRADPPGDGILAENWFTSTGSANLDSGAIELATPKSANY